MWIFPLFLISHTVDLNYNIKYHTADLREEDIVEMEVKKVENEVNYYLFNSTKNMPEYCKNILASIQDKGDIKNLSPIKGLNPVRLKVIGIKKTKEGEYRIRLQLQTLSKEANQKIGNNEIILDMNIEGGHYNGDIKAR